MKNKTSKTASFTGCNTNKKSTLKSSSKVTQSSQKQHNSSSEQTVLNNNNTTHITSSTAMRTTNIAAPVTHNYTETSIQAFEAQRKSLLVSGSSPGSSRISGNSSSQNSSNSLHSSINISSNNSSTNTHATSSSSQTKKSKKSSQSTTTPSLHEHNTHKNNIDSSNTSSNRHANRKMSTPNNSSSISVHKQPFRNSIFSLLVAVFLAVALVSSNPQLSSLLNNKLRSYSMSSSKNAYNFVGNNNNARYIRSVSNQDMTNDQEQTIISKITNGVTDVYHTKVSPAVRSILGKAGIQIAGGDNSQNNLRAADLSNLSKNGKLHYIPSSGFDPSKTAHHVLEGAGYRLNIPSYVQTIPNSQENINSNNIQNNQENSGSTTGINSESIIKNDDFDLAISQKQVMRPRPVFGSGIQTSASANSNANSIANSAMADSDDAPLSKVDPQLDLIIKEMLEKRQQQQKYANSFGSTSPGSFASGSSGQGGSSPGFNLVRKPNATEIFSKDSELGHCSPQKDIVFAKTHKTGGTTITNMLLRHAERQELNVALPVEYHWELAGYPAQYNANLITPKQEENYNVMCHHMRFDKSEIEKQVNPLADYFTILRDPVTNFESSFGFFKDYPFTSWLDNARSIDDFVNNAETYYNKSTPWYFRAKNYMSFDLGFNHEDNSEAYIRHAIAKMEEDFKFVMITDRYEESMILLKNMLCLDYDDIVYLPLKVRTDNDRKKISADTAAKIKQWNRLDTAIYEYFAQRFEQMTVEYGKDKLAREVEILKEKLKDVEARCVEDYDSQSLKPWIKRIKLRKPSGQKCQRLVWGEVKYADYLRQVQYSKMSEEDYNNQPNLDDKISLMQEVQKEILGDLGEM